MIVVHGPVHTATTQHGHGRASAAVPEPCWCRLADGTAWSSMQRFACSPFARVRHSTLAPDHARTARRMKVSRPWRRCPLVVAPLGSVLGVVDPGAKSRVVGLGALPRSFAPLRA